MAVCNVVDVALASNHQPLGDDLEFRVTIDVAEPLAEDVLFQCFYCVPESCASRKPDIELDSVDVGHGPGLPQGVLQFDFTVPAPTRRAVEEGGGVTEVAGLYLSAKYRGAEFCRVGFYVRYEYEDPAMEAQPPEQPVWEKLLRVLSIPPSVTRFPCKWDGHPPLPEKKEVEALDGLPRSVLRARRSRSRSPARAAT